MKEQIADRLANSAELATVSKGAIGTGASAAVIFGVNAQVVGIIAGIVIGLAGLIYQIWSGERRFKHFQERLKNEYSARDSE